MIATIMRALALSAALLAAMWVGSLWVYDSEKMGDALQWRWAELHGEPLYIWDFNAPTEVTHGHGLSEFEWSGGTVSGDHQDPYFYLNLEGRYIDSARFTQIRLRLRSVEENALRLFHRQTRKDRIHASELVPLSPGWQTLSLSLPALKWHAKDLGDSDGTAPESSWGGAGGIVTALRVDPVRNGAFEVDWIELEDTGDGPRLVGEVETFKGLDDALFERMRSEPDRTWHIAHDNWLRTPESAQRTRLKIAAEFPSAIVFPRVPDQGQLALPPLGDGLSSPFIPASFFIAALLFLVVRDQVPRPWRQVVSVIALFTLVEAYVYWIPSLTSLWRVLLAIPLLETIWELVPKTAPRYLIGEARAWLLVSPILVISCLVIVVAAYEGVEGYSMLEDLGTYFLWALFQQFVIAVLILSRLKEISGNICIFLSAGLFGLLHFPNFALMAATFLLGIALLHIYERYQNLLAIAAAQAFLAVGFNTLALQFFWLSRTVGPGFTAGL